MTCCDEKEKRMEKDAVGTAEGACGPKAEGECAEPCTNAEPTPPPAPDPDDAAE